MNSLTTTDYATISKIELLAAKSWPAREEENISGWILRAHDGVTARANSVLPYTNRSEIELSSLVKTAIEFYHTRDFPPYR